MRAEPVVVFTSSVNSLGMLTSNPLRNTPKLLDKVLRPLSMSFPKPSVWARAVYLYWSSVVGKFAPLNDVSNKTASLKLPSNHLAVRGCGDKVEPESNEY